MLTDLDPQRQQQAKTYARLQRRLLLVELALGAGFLLAWVFLGWSQALKAALEPWLRQPWLLAAGYALIFGGSFALLNLPLAYYEGFVLPHRFGLSTQSLPDWILDQLKAGVLGGLIGLFVLQVVYAFLRAAPQTWWLWVAGFLLVFNVLAANLAPVLLYPIFFKFKPLGEEHAGLEARLERLAEQAGAQVRGVYSFDMSRRTTAANAALTGLGNTRRIILGDTLLNQFSADEIETVLAHELAHHVHKDIPVGIAVESAITLIGLYLASLGMGWGIDRFGFSGPGDIAALPLLALVLGAYGLVSMPLTNAYSRWRERRADEYALRVTRNGPAFVSAFTRLANQNLADADPPAWEEFLLYSHPALGKRIARAATYPPG